MREHPTASPASEERDPTPRWGPRSAGMALLLAGVDGGGTKTTAVVATEQLLRLGEGQSGPSNFLRVGTEAAVRAVLEALEDACQKAGFRVSDLEAIGIGLAGIAHPMHYRRMREALFRALTERAARARDLWSAENVLLTTDAEIALYGATDGQPGVVIISGTGSIAYGMNAHGQKARSGGWGPTFGDEGSGYDIARRALAAVASAYDGRMPPTRLTERICQYFGIESPAELPRIIYGNEASPNIAPLSEVVIHAAREGDAVARHILRDAGRELARTAIAVIKRLRLQHEVFRVSYVGGVFSAGELILDPLRETIHKVAPRAEIGPPLFPPAVGALKMVLARLHAPGHGRERARSAQPLIAR